MADKNDHAIVRLSDRAWNRYPLHTLFHRAADVVEEIGGVGARKGGRSNVVVPCRDVGLHDEAKCGAVKASPAGVGCAHALRVFEEQILDQCRACDKRTARRDRKIFGCRARGWREGRRSKCGADSWAHGRIHAIRDLLPQLITSHSSKLIENMRELDNVVSKSTTTVEEFVRKIEYLEKSQKLIPKFRDDCILIVSYSKLMEEQGWPLADNLKASLAYEGDLLMGLGTRKKNVRISEARLEEDSANFIAKIEKQVPVLKKNIATLKDAISIPMVDDADADNDMVLDYLSKQEAELEKLKKEADNFQNYQTMLKQPQTDFEMLVEARQDLNLKMRLWMGLKDWNNLTQGWKDALFTDIDTGDISEKVTQYNKLISAASRGLPGNMVVPKLRFMVEDFKTLLPVISHLRVKSLEASTLG